MLYKRRCESSKDKDPVIELQATAESTWTQPRELEGWQQRQQAAAAAPPGAPQPGAPQAPAAYPAPGGGLGLGTDPRLSDVLRRAQLLEQDPNKNTKAQRKPRSKIGFLKGLGSFEGLETSA